MGFDHDVGSLALLAAESEAAVQSALDRAMRTDGRTVIVIAHRCVCGTAEATRPQRAQRALPGRGIEHRQGCSCGVLPLVILVYRSRDTVPAQTAPPRLTRPRRLSTVRNADQTVVMDKGRVAEVGTHAQLMRRGGIYAALVRRQAGAVLDQDRDLAPHERQFGENGGGGEGRGPDGDAGSSGDAVGSSDVPAGDPALPDSLPHWKQQRVKAEQDTA